MIDIKLAVAIVQLSDDRTTVLSVDIELCSALLAKGVEATNFNHLRDNL